MLVTPDCNHQFSYETVDYEGYYYGKGKMFQRRCLNCNSIEFITFIRNNKKLKIRDEKTFEIALETL